MTVNHYQLTSWNWQVSQFGQKITEWWELQTTNALVSFPKINLPTWLNSPLWQNIIKFSLWTLFVLIILRIAWFLWQEFKPYLSWLLTGKRPDFSSTIIELPLTRENWTAKAEQYQRQGDYEQACLCLYQAMLQNIDYRKVAVAQASRTDGEYWSLLRRSPCSGSYQTLLDIHQDICFGGIMPSSTTWQSCLNAYQEIEKNEIF